jgi:hypothetical protein
MIGGAFPLSAVLHLIDDCIVPALVTEFLRSRVNLPDSTDSAHNVDQL